MISRAELRDAFIHAEPRPGQLEALERIMANFDAGKRFVLLEAPVGSGKSAIGLTAAAVSGSCYYLTIQKILQSQISRDYAGYGLVELRGRNAYPCPVLDSAGLKQINRRDCSNGYCRVALNKAACPSCFLSNRPEGVKERGNLTILPDEMSYSACPYYEQVYRAINAPHVLMNFSSFLMQYHYTPRFGPRDLLVLDEGHHAEEQLLDFVSIGLNDIDLLPFGIKLPNLEFADDYVAWMDKVSLFDIIGQMMEEAKAEQDNHRADDCERLINRCKHLAEVVNTEPWIAEYKEVRSNRHSHGIVSIKPLEVASMAEKLLFAAGRQILMMSATILDAGSFCRSLGIKVDDVTIIKLAHQFPKENRPVYVMPAARVVGGKGNVQSWGPQLIETVDRLATNHVGQRGIIHTHTFHITELLRDGCETAERFFLQRNFPDKDQMLAAFYERPDGIIVAPAMHEGLSLDDDLSRFQIVCKVPYPNFFDDKRLAAKVRLDHRYLIWLTAIKLVQSVGRSVRSADDWAHTYIIDSTLSTKFLAEAKKILPKWFAESLVALPLSAPLPAPGHPAIAPAKTG